MNTLAVLATLVVAAFGLLGLVVPALGVLAGTCLVLLLGGAVGTHLRNRDGLPGIAPALVLGAVACGYVVLAVGQLS